MDIQYKEMRGVRSGRFGHECRVSGSHAWLLFAFEEPHSCFAFSFAV